VDLEVMKNKLFELRAPRHDAKALAFGVAFVLLGVMGLLRTAGVAIDAAALSQLALVALGSAGLVALLVSGRRRV
jgi:hypothetical protein